MRTLSGRGRSAGQTVHNPVRIWLALRPAGRVVLTFVQGVSAVVTTGIYCRPGCGAKPLAQNVRTFPVAAAAEAAGYRACLQCRPYRRALVVDWAAPELVCRGIQLTLDGLLDHGTEATLADRLGVSPRHLRRLFMVHLGVTPDGLARSVRAHFARRLLDDTDLTITEIAFAAGFGSVRQFNRVCQQVFRSTPRELRSKRRKADRLVADGGLTLRLAFEGALDWPAVVAHLAVTAIPGVEYVHGDVYRRTVVVRGDPGVLELCPGGDDHLLLRAHLPHWRDLLHIVNRARRIPSLDASVEEPVRQLEHDPVIGPLVRDRPGVRVPGTWDAFETGVRSIVGQQLPWTAASVAMARLVETYGTPVGGLRPLGLGYTFPQPGLVAVADLSGLGLSETTAIAIRGFARGLANGVIRLDRSTSVDRLVTSVGALEGVGAWTAHYLALRLGEPDACPLSDRDLRRHLPERSDPAHLARVIDGWRPWRALAVTHLWAKDGAPAPAEQEGAA
jgi:AraC family transcriptional regulator of adaptative response / DNA-3-methyladenine glycosylase II